VGNLWAIFIQFGIVFTISHCILTKNKTLESVYFQGFWLIFDIFQKLPAAGLELSEYFLQSL